ncbi:MAG: hypothetical protein WCD08_11060 [Steroidobacteraceae bacterium]
MASAISVRINYGIEICTELSGIDPRGSSSGIGDGGARYKATSPNGSQFSDRCAVSANDNRPPGFDLTKYCAGLVTKLPLGDGTVFHT